MTFYIKAWPDNTATLMTEIGQILWTFPSVEEAAQACQEWYDINSVKTDYEDIACEGLDCTASFVE